MPKPPLEELMYTEYNLKKKVKLNVDFLSRCLGVARRYLEKKGFLFKTYVLPKSKFLDKGVVIHIQNEQGQILLESFFYWDSKVFEVWYKNKECLEEFERAISKHVVCSNLEKMLLYSKNAFAVHGI